MLIKVQILGVTPQKSVTLAGPTTVREIFKQAEIDLSGNYMFKIDGVPVGIDDTISSGSLLIGTVQIKGN